jgi:hypothetical protein
MPGFGGYSCRRVLVEDANFRKMTRPSPSRRPRALNIFPPPTDAAGASCLRQILAVCGPDEKVKLKARL